MPRSGGIAQVVRRRADLRIVEPGSLPVVLAVLGAPLALFRRKGRDGVELEPAAPSDAPEVPGLPPTTDPFGAGTADEPPPASSDPGSTEGPLRPAARAPRPAPHRQRPGELWHPPIEVAPESIPPPLVPEERVDPAEVSEGPGPASVLPEAPGDGATTGDADDVTPVEVLHAADVADDPAPATKEVDPPRARPFIGGDVASGSARPSGAAVVAPAAPASAEAPPPSRPRIKPPTDIFDVAPADLAADDLAPTDQAAGAASATTPAGTSAVTSAVTSDSVSNGDDDPEVAGLVDGPVARRGASSASARRSLFGTGEPVGSGDASAQIPTSAQAPEGSEPAAVSLAIDDSGEVVVDIGVIRLAEHLRPDVIETSERITLTIGSGWCWIASAHASLPVRLTVPSGVLTAHPSCRCLAVVQADGSTFVSVVSGAVTLEHDVGVDADPRELGAGTIAHVPVGGEVTTDTASPDEMAADAILTSNLRLDDARSAGRDVGGR
jgi:hypothetical protein